MLIELRVNLKMENYLVHHGILGQKWGKRNGPPYPLDYEAHSVEQKQKNPKGRLDNYGGGGSDSHSYRINRKGSNDTKSFSVSYQKGPDLKTPISKRSISEKEAADYRNEMIERYSKNPERAKFYQNASKEEIDADIRRKQEIRRNICVAAGMVGLTAGLYVAYRKGVFDYLKNTPPGEIKTELLNKICRNTKDELDLVLEKGTTLDRMVAFKDFDPEKVTAPLFASYQKNDVDTYKVFLQDFSGTGERYHLQLETLNDIVAPNRAHTKEIFNVFRDNDEFNNCLAELYTEKLKANKIAKYFKTPLTGEDIKKFSNKKFFNVTMWSLAKEGKSTDMLIDEARKQGYNAFRDYHDIDGKFSKAPLILLNPKSDISAIGSKLVTEADRRTSLSNLARNKQSLPISARLATEGATLVSKLPNFKVSWLSGMKPNS